MRRSIQWSLLGSAAAVVLAACGTMGSVGGKSDPTFFVTSSGPGKGADLGGLAGADAQCQMLASKVGVGDKTWRAYLSTQPLGGATGVNARDRIGKGPWKNAKGVVVATDVANLHSAANNLNKLTALTERGRRHQRPRRRAEPARYADRLAARRHVHRRPTRTRLRQLDPKRRRRRDGRPP